MPPGSLLQEFLKRNCKKDQDQDLHAGAPKRIPQGRHKRTCCCRRGSCKILIEEPPKSIPEDLSYKHLSYMASARSSRKDLLGRILPGSPQVLLTRTCTRSCKNLLQQRGLHQDLHKIFLEGPVQDRFEDVSRIFARSCHKDLHKIMQGPLTGLQQGLRNIFSQGPQQDLGQYISYNYHGPPRLHHETLARSS